MNDCRRGNKMRNKDAQHVQEKRIKTALYTVHCTLYTVHCTLYSRHCTVDIVQ